MALVTRMEELVSRVAVSVSNSHRGHARITPTSPLSLSLSLSLLVAGIKMSNRLFRLDMEGDVSCV